MIYMGYWDVQIKTKDDEFMVLVSFDSPALESQNVGQILEHKLWSWRWMPKRTHKQKQLENN